MLTSQYDEVVVNRLCEGTVQLNQALIPLRQATERLLGLDETRRRRTTVRLDADSGSLDDLNWLLSRGYQVICKNDSAARATRLIHQVPWWTDDPKVAGRQVGWVSLPATEYVRPVSRLTGRCRKASICVLISTLAPAEMLAYVTCYDQQSAALQPLSKATNRGWVSPNAPRSDSPLNK